eukprot:s2652_g12.t1
MRYFITFTAFGPCLPQPFVRRSGPLGLLLGATAAPTASPPLAVVLAGLALGFGFRFTSATTNFFLLARATAGVAAQLAVLLRFRIFCLQLHCRRPPLR